MKLLTWLIGILVLVKFEKKCKEEKKQIKIKLNSIFLFIFLNSLFGLGH